MAVPKRRMSRANTRSRRSQWKAKRQELVGVTVAGRQHKVPRRLLKAARLGLIDLDRRRPRPHRRASQVSLRRYVDTGGRADTCR
jgi:large subunit ribosomal protein L32